MSIASDLDYLVHLLGPRTRLPLAPPDAAPAPLPLVDAAPVAADAAPARAPTSRTRQGRVRARTQSIKRLSKRDLAAEAREHPPEINAADPRPATWAACQARTDRAPGDPCPYVSCAAHRWLDVNPRSGAIKTNFPALAGPEELRDPCVLEIADRGEHTLEDIAATLNMTRERIRQIERKMLARLRARLDDAGVTLADLDPEPGPQPGAWQRGRTTGGVRRGGDAGEPDATGAFYGGDAVTRAYRRLRLARAGHALATLRLTRAGKLAVLRSVATSRAAGAHVHAWHRVTTLFAGEFAGVATSVCVACGAIGRTCGAGATAIACRCGAPAVVRVNRIAARCAACAAEE